MQLRADALAAHLARGPLARIYTVSGDEPLLAIEAIDAIRAAARAAGFGEREVLHASAQLDWSQLTAAASHLSLFAPRKIVELRLPGGKPGRAGAEALAAYAGDAPEHVLLIVALPKLDGATRKSNWVAALQQAGVWIDVPRVERAQLPAWIKARLARQRQSATAAALEFLADRVEGNLLAAQQEIAKLGLLYPPGELSLDQVTEAVLDVSRFEAFDLPQALLAGDAARAVRMLAGLRAEGEALPLVLWVVTEELRALVRARQALAAGQPLAALKNELKLWGPRERLLPQAARRVADAPALLARCAEVDRLAKGLRAPGCDADPWLELTDIVLAATQ
jgi:DNA polymerase-3 subunit delta